MPGGKVANASLPIPRSTLSLHQKCEHFSTFFSSEPIIMTQKRSINSVFVKKKREALSSDLGHTHPLTHSTEETPISIHLVTKDILHDLQHFPNTSAQDGTKSLLPYSQPNFCFLGCNKKLYISPH